jgi:phage-related protein
MAAKLEAFYQESQTLVGLKAKMRLAILTGIPSAQAGSVPDSPENLKKFQAGMAEIKKEFK